MLSGSPRSPHSLPTAEVGESEDVRQFGPSCWWEAFQALSQCLLHLLEGHETGGTHRTVSDGGRPSQGSRNACSISSKVTRRAVLIERLVKEGSTRKPATARSLRQEI